MSVSCRQLKDIRLERALADQAFIDYGKRAETNHADAVRVRIVLKNTIDSIDVTPNVASMTI